MNTAALNKAYIEKVMTSPDAHLQAYQNAKNTIANSTAIYHGEPVPFPYVPKLFTADIAAKLAEIAAVTHGILSKVIKAYVTDKDYRRLFAFDELTEQLILKENHYDSQLPMARIDLFLNEETLDFKFCEFNADGTSAMNEDRELVSAIKETLGFQEFEKSYELVDYELLSSWIREVRDIYSTFVYKKEDPLVLIADFNESATPYEFLEFQKRFRQAGFRCEVADVRDIDFRNNQYWYQDTPADIIYRRVVTGELIGKAEEAPAFIQGLLCNELRTCVIGAPRTQVIHNKLVFELLHRTETLEKLSLQEQDFVKKHVPLTYQLNMQTVNEHNVLFNKDAWIIKPEDLYGARGVYAGVDYSEDHWVTLVEKSLNQGYLLQEYCTPYVTENLVVNETGRFERVRLGNLTGLYTYNGKFKGVLSRAGAKGIISAHNQGFTLPTFVVKEKS